MGSSNCVSQKKINLARIKLETRFLFKTLKEVYQYIKFVWSSIQLEVEIIYSAAKFCITSQYIYIHNFLMHTTYFYVPIRLLIFTFYNFDAKKE